MTTIVAFIISYFICLSHWHSLRFHWNHMSIHRHAPTFRIHYYYRTTESIIMKRLCKFLCIFSTQYDQINEYMTSEQKSRNSCIINVFGFIGTFNYGKNGWFYCFHTNDERCAREYTSNMFQLFIEWIDDDRVQSP